MTKTKKIIIGLCFVCIVLGLVLCAVALAMYGGTSGIMDMSTLKYAKNTYEISESFENINIKEIECDVTVLPSQDGKCKIIATESAKVYNEISVENGTLTIKRRDTRKWYDHIGIVWYSDMTLTLYLSQSEYNSLTLGTVSGDAELDSSLCFRTAKVTSTSGDIDIPCSVGEELTAESTSGTINIKDVTCNANVTAKTVSGEIKIKNVSVAGLSVSSSSGGVYVTDTVAKGEIYAKTVSGRIKLERSDAGGLEIKSTSGSVYCGLLTKKNVSTRPRAAA